MRGLLLTGVLFAVALPLQAQETEPARAPAVRTWTPGGAAPLPIRIHFFSSQPENVLDSIAVARAAEVALLAVGLPPDIAVSRRPAQWNSSDRMHLQLEVNVYSGGEVRFERRPMGADRVPLSGCSGEAQWGSPEPLWAVLHLSHRIRSAIECMQRTYAKVERLPA